MAAVTLRPLEDHRGDGVPSQPRRPSPQRIHVRAEGLRQGRLERVDGGQLCGGGRGEEPAGDLCEGGIGHERPLTAFDRTAGRPRQISQLTGQRSMRRHAGNDCLIERDARVAVRPRGDRRTEAGRHSDELAKSFEPLDRNVG
jgi:hypothetical protein